MRCAVPPPQLLQSAIFWWKAGFVCRLRSLKFRLFSSKPFWKIIEQRWSASHSKRLSYAWGGDRVSRCWALGWVSVSWVRVQVYIGRSIDVLFWTLYIYNRWVKLIVWAPKYKTILLLTISLWLINNNQQLYYIRLLTYYLYRPFIILSSTKHRYSLNTPGLFCLRTQDSQDLAIFWGLRFVKSIIMVLPQHIRRKSCLKQK